jgi:hypothetical protein
MLGRLSILGLAAAALTIGTPSLSAAMPVAPLKAQVGEIDHVIDVKNHKGGGGGNKARGNNRGNAKANNNRARQNVKVNKTNKNVKVNKVNKTVKHVDKKVVHKTVVHRPYRAWVHRPYYGAVIAGVTLGTVIAVSTPRVVPVLTVANPNLCWYWSDPAEINGYWDYCAPPL